MKKKGFKAAFEYLTATDRGLERTGLRHLVTTVNLPALFTPSALPRLDIATAVRKEGLHQHPAIDSTSAALIREEWSRYLARVSVVAEQPGKIRHAGSRPVPRKTARKGDKQR